MSTIAKSQGLIRELKQRLAMRFPSYVITESQDVQGAMLLISADSTPATTEEVIAIRIKALPTPFKNSIGLDQQAFVPMVMQVIQEEDAIGLASQCKFDLEFARLGVSQERYQVAAGAPASLSMFAVDGSVSTASLVVAIDFDSLWPLAGQ